MMNATITQKQKMERSAKGKLLVVKRVGFPYDGFYIVKSTGQNPLTVLVHNNPNLIWPRDEFRVAWQETLQYQKDKKVFLQKMQNTEHVLTGLTELGVSDNGFHDLALAIPFWL